MDVIQLDITHLDLEELAIDANRGSIKEEHKAKKRKRNLLRIWNDRQSRVSWTPDMKFNECKNSIYKFYPVKNLTNYGRCYSF